MNKMNDTRIPRLIAALSILWACAACGEDGGGGGGGGGEGDVGEDVAAGDVGVDVAQSDSGEDSGGGDGGGGDAAVDVDAGPCTGAWSVVQTLDNPMPGAKDFGVSLAADGDRLVVGSTGENARGVVFVYARGGSGWTLEQTIEPEPPAAEQTLFGQSVGLRDGVLVVGAPLGDRGSLHIYEEGGGGFAFAARVLPPEGPMFAGLGASVGFVGDLVLGGAPRQSATGTNAGAIYGYTREGGAWSDPIAVAISPTAGLRIGQSLASLDDQVFAPMDRAVLVYGVTPEGDRGQLGSFENPATSTTDDFGTSVVAGDGEIIVGAPGSNWAERHGSVLVFRPGGRQGWERVQRLEADDKREQDAFGYALALEGDLLAVGASVPFGMEGVQALYLFERGDDESWSQLARVADPVEGGAFGQAVALSGRTVLVSDGSHDDRAGAVYVVECRD